MTRVEEMLRDISPDDLPGLVAAVRDAEVSAGELADTASVLVLRNFTVDGIEPFIKYHLLKAGLRPSVVFGGFDTVSQDLLALRGQPAQQLDALVLGLHLPVLAPDSWSAGWRSRPVADRLEALYDSAADSTPALVLVNTFVLPFFVHRQPGIGELEWEVHALNDFVRTYVHEHSDRFALVDWDRLVRILGWGGAMDPRYWYLATAPFKNAFLNLAAFEIARPIRASRGRAKKCLVLDCDNTLWGGVVGEDGRDNLQLDPHTYPGKAYHDFQKSVLDVLQRGVVLALCSKNNEADVWDVLDHHEHCLIRREHLAAWRINWNNKADNLLQIANELNLGLDSFVMVDDSPAEAELLRQLVPEVTVVPVPERVYLLPSLLSQDGYFDLATVTSEDRDRSAMYRTEQERTRVREAFTDLDSYLAHLELRLRIHPALDTEASRVAQLTQRTNQFNLTTRRYEERDVRRFMSEEGSAVYTMSAADRFGDYGLTGVMVLRTGGRHVVVDSLLLSCRVLGRRLELAFVAHVLAAQEKAWDIDGWRAAYVPTAKNHQVENFWEELGFDVTHAGPEGREYEVGVGLWRVGATIDFISIEGN